MQREPPSHRIASNSSFVDAFVIQDLKESVRCTIHRVSGGRKANCAAVAGEIGSEDVEIRFEMFGDFCPVVAAAEKAMQ